MLDLISLWLSTVQKNQNKSESLRNYPKNTDPTAINFDIYTTQSSFEFIKQPKIIFVKNAKTLEPANFYDDLPNIELTTEEQSICSKVVVEEKNKSPHFYDGNQMIISGIIYDDSSNTLYLEASKISYSFIVSLRDKKFPENSPLYQRIFFQTGVLSPLITRNNKTVFLKRTQFGLFSVPGGFLEVHDEAKIINFEDGKNLITETAMTEIKEEIAGIKGKKTLRFNYSVPQITAISFRQTETNPIGTVEFIAPSFVDCHSSYLEQVLSNNLAEDAHEHTSKYELVPLDSQDREELLTKLLKGPISLPGAPLYVPNALSLTRLLNPNSHISLPREVPNSRSIAWPLSLFTPKPEQPLSLNGENSIEDTNDRQFNLIS